ncbi:MAG: AAA family ATPase [Sulfuricurvum sp.]
MIKSLSIEAFKCFEKESLEFRNLTILTGTNASGKSSVIQALLQLALHANNDYSSPLAHYLNFIAEFDETINFNMDVDEYRLSLEGFEDGLAYLFKRGGDIINLQDNQSIKESISYSKGNLVFLSADRIGPQDTYSKNTNPLDRFGIYGEYAISFLERARRNRNEVIDELIQDSNTRKVLDSQVNYWLEYILDTEIKTQEIEGTNQVKAQFRNGNAFVRPKNIGSGISYLASILIICLSAQKEQIIIIENPEIHLHPQAQSKIGEFLAFVASKGVQIIIETHNDHLINRICYEQFKGTLRSEEVVIHYKQSLYEPFETLEIVRGNFKNENNENRFPEGFYDATIQEIFEING